MLIKYKFNNDKQKSDRLAVAMDEIKIMKKIGKTATNVELFEQKF